MALLVYSKFKPAGSFFAMDAKDVEVEGETLMNYIPIILTQEEYNILLDGGAILVNGKEHFLDENRIYMVKKYIDNTGS